MVSRLYSRTPRESHFNEIQSIQDTRPVKGGTTYGVSRVEVRSSRKQKINDLGLIRFHRRNQDVLLSSSLIEKDRFT